jgi:LysM repeat protein
MTILLRLAALLLAAALLAATATPGLASHTYTVQPGDILSAIAERFGTTVEALARANDIADPDRI